MRRWLGGLVLGLAACGRLGYGTIEPGGDGDGDGDPDGGVGALDCDETPPAGELFYVATDGSNDAGGTEQAPWATLEFAVANAAPGGTILVAPGTYPGLDVTRQADPPITLRSAPRYGAIIESAGSAIGCDDCRGLIVEGFEIRQLGGAGDAPLMLFSRADVIRLRHNIIHDARRNAQVRFSGGYSDVLVERNVMYNSGTNTMVHLASGTGGVVRDNVMFSDFAAAGHVPERDGAINFVWVEDAEGTGSTDHIIRRNVFRRWEDDPTAGFIQVTGALRVKVENNLFVGDGTAPMVAALYVEQGADVVYRNNTVTGDLPVVNSYALLVDDDSRVELANNIWSDPSQTMDPLITAMPAATVVLDNNLYWNGGAAIPSNLPIAGDGAAVEADPGLAAASPRPGPIWQPEAVAFVGGGASACDVFEAELAAAAIAAASPAFAAADASRAPADDIRGEPRPAAPSIGAFEP